MNIAFTSRSAAALRKKISPTAARPCRPLPLRVAAALPRAVPDADRSVIYKFAIDRVNGLAAGYVHRDL